VQIFPVIPLLNAGPILFLMCEYPKPIRDYVHDNLQIYGKINDCKTLGIYSGLFE
jgi:hypothetical protein